jgi:hypothetical protein
MAYYAEIGCSHSTPQSRDFTDNSNIRELKMEEPPEGKK